MGHVASAMRHAGSLYSRGFRWVLRPIQEVEAEAHHLHEVEKVGESGETPFIAILGVFLFLVPVAASMMLVALAATYLAH